MILIRKFAIAMLFAVCSMPAWAGNWSCTLSSSLSGQGGNVTQSGQTVAEACQAAAQEACPVWVAAYIKAHPTAKRSCDPVPLGINPNSPPVGYPGICPDGACTSANQYVCVSDTSLNPPGACASGGGPAVVSFAQISTGTNWGPQYGTPHTYDSTAGSTPDNITYVAPEDGQANIEIDANQSLNGTTITSVTALNSYGTPTLTVQHTQSNPDIWKVSGAASPLSTFTIGVTFSHTGGYGEYVVKMNTANSGGPRYAYVPTMSFCPNFTNCNSTGITYSVQSATYQVVGSKVIVDMYVQLTSKGTQAGYVEMSLPIPEAYPFSVTCSGGGVDTSDVGALIVNVCSNSAQFQYAGGLFLDNTTVNNSSFFRANFWYEWQ